MSHVTERIAEFVFEELSATEMAEVGRHLEECPDCREQADRFRLTLTSLRSAQDLEPPRNLVFDFEKPVKSRLWRWLPAGAAIAALLLVTIALAGRVQVEWRDSQLTIGFGQTRPAVQSNQSAELAAEIQRMKGYLAYIEGRQETVERNTIAIAATLEPLARAQRPSSGD